MRGAAILLLLAAVAAADPFELRREGMPLDDAAYARYAETLALLRGAMDRDPAGSLERAVDLLEPFGLAHGFEDLVTNALARAPEGPARAALLALGGRLLVAKGMENANVWVIGPNGVIRQGGVDDAAKKMLKVAAGMVRDAIRLRPRDARAREDLATALEAIEEEGAAEEAQRLRTEAAAIRMEGRPPPEPTKPGEWETLRREAEALEQKEEGPDHAAALLLRKQALVREFCAYTIPAEYDPALYGPVSLLASEDLVIRNLTRTYRKRDGTVDSVAPTYHAPKPAQRLQIVAALGRDPGAAAGAALVKLLATAAARDPVTEAALRALETGRHEAVRRNLPALLERAVYGDMDFESAAGGILFLGDFAPGGDRGAGEALLVEAAVLLDVKEAAPVLAKLLPLERDLIRPRGIAAALGRLGGPEHADALLAVARDPSRDVYFRREAILALGRVAPDRLAGVPAEPHLELALAAARYRAEPSEALRGRLLQGLGHPHEADDAARYVTDLSIREAVPDLERFLEEKPDHYAAEAVRDARDRLAR